MKYHTSFLFLDPLLLGIPSALYYLREKNNFSKAININKNKTASIHTIYYSIYSIKVA